MTFIASLWSVSQHTGTEDHRLKLSGLDSSTLKSSILLNLDFSGS
jgi:hypothetical protein